jgi:hypothetical protein
MAMAKPTATLNEYVDGGALKRISKHTTLLEAIKAGVEYRKANPSARMLEIYAYNQPLPDGRMETSHSHEDRHWWAKLAANG